MESLLMELRKFESELHRRIDNAMPKTEKGKLFHVQALVLQYLIECEGGNVCQKDVEEHLNIRSSSATKLLQRMEENGLIVRSAAPNDKRVKYVSSTEKAKTLMNRGFREMSRITAEVEKGVDDAEKRIFLKVLKQLGENAEAAFDAIDFSGKEEL